MKGIGNWISKLIKDTNSICFAYAYFFLLVLFAIIYTFFPAQFHHSSLEYEKKSIELKEQLDARIKNDIGEFYTDILGERELSLGLHSSEHDSNILQYVYSYNHFAQHKTKDRPYPKIISKGFLLCKVPILTHLRASIGTSPEADYYSFSCENIRFEVGKIDFEQNDVAEFTPVSYTHLTLPTTTYV